MRKIPFFPYSVLVGLKFSPSALFLPSAFVLFLGLVGPLSTVKAIEIDNDYFSPTRDNALLNTNESYHLSRKTFLSYYREGLVTGEFIRAINELQFVLRYWPNHPRALMYLASIAQMKNDFNLADEPYRKALSLYPQHAITHAQYGHFLVEAGRIDKGIVHLNQAIELNEQLVIAYEWLADGYNRQGDLQKGKEALKNAEHWRKAGENKE